MGKEKEGISSKYSYLHPRRQQHQNNVPILTGQLIATPLCGVGFRTETQEGITNHKCEFRYVPGERVTFFIGKACLPTASTGSTVTPYDMGSTSNETINTIRLVQSLSWTRKGILTIPASVALWATGAIDFSIDPIDFANQASVITMLQHMGCKLLDAQTAISRLDELICRYFLGL